MKVNWKGKNIDYLESIFFGNNTLKYAIDKYNKLKDTKYLISDVDVESKSTNGFELTEEYINLNITYESKQLELFNYIVKSKFIPIEIRYIEERDYKIKLFILVGNDITDEIYLGEFFLEGGGSDMKSSIMNTIIKELKSKLY